jgi:alkaline phosphatase D
MNMITSVFLVIGFAFSISCQPKYNKPESDEEQSEKSFAQYPEKPANRTIIAFGSCSRQNISNQRWDVVSKHDPDLWIWLGDNIYGDTHDMNVMARKYDLQKEHPGYQQLLGSNTQIIGTWDDHDYGINDGGKHYTMKDESKKLFMDFLDIPDDHPITEHEGVYQSYDYRFHQHLLKIILLDTRYFRDTVYRDLASRAYKPNIEGDILGEPQWQWLEKELFSSNADLILIGSSIQVIPEEHIYEKWANFPSARNKLLELLGRYPDKRVVLLSGDRHIAEISEMKLDYLNYPLYDFTSSGLTHTWNSENIEANRYRVSDFIIQLNFGLIIIDWNTKNNHSIIFQIRGENDQLLYEFKPQLFLN